MPRKLSKIQEIHRKMGVHASILMLPETPKTVKEFHKTCWETLRAQMMEYYKNKKEVSPEVAKARDARWRHFGKIGQLRWAQTSIRYLGSYAGDDIAKLITEIDDKLTQLINLLSTRKPN